MKDSELLSCLDKVCNGSWSDVYSLRLYFSRDKIHDDQKALKKQMKMAFKYLSEKSKAGNLFATAFLGMCNEEGWGTDQDEKNARKPRGHCMKNPLLS